MRVLLGEFGGSNLRVIENKSLLCRRSDPVGCVKLKRPPCRLPANALPVWSVTIVLNLTLPTMRIADDRGSLQVKPPCQLRRVCRLRIDAFERETTWRGRQAARPLKATESLRRRRPLEGPLKSSHQNL